MNESEELYRFSKREDELLILLPDALECAVRKAAEDLRSVYTIYIYEKYGVMPIEITRRRTVFGASGYKIILDATSKGDLHDAPALKIKISPFRSRKIFRLYTIELEGSPDEAFEQKQVLWDDNATGGALTEALIQARARIEDLEEIVVRHQIAFGVRDVYVEAPDGWRMLDNYWPHERQWLDLILPEPDRY